MVNALPSRFPFQPDSDFFLWTGDTRGFAAAALAVFLPHRQLEVRTKLGLSLIPSLGCRRGPPFCFGAVKGEYLFFWLRLFCIRPLGPFPLKKVPRSAHPCPPYEFFLFSQCRSPQSWQTSNELREFPFRSLDDTLGPCSNSLTALGRDLKPVSL